MIQNERQYRITRQKLADLERSLATARDNPGRLPEALYRASVESMESLMADLRAELVDYEHLRSRSIEALPLKSLNDLPAVLVQARIARGWSQRQLAEALHVKPQQVQRDERDGYRRATLERLVKTAEVLGLRVDTEVRLTLTA